MDHVDLNCDLGELEGSEGLHLDTAILPLITSANVACGAHAGSVTRMHQLAALCRKSNVAFGAHPGYPDRTDFGRKAIDMTSAQISDMIREQVRIAAETAESEGIVLAHVKPHGALYNLASHDSDAAAAIALAVRDICPVCRLVGLSGSKLIGAGKSAGLMTVSEVFADRNYHADGSLVSRLQPNSVLDCPELVSLRAVQMILSQSVTSIEGTRVPVLAETICVHGDSPNALECIRQLRLHLESSGIRIRS